MRDKFKKNITLLLCACMMIPMGSIFAFADAEETVPTDNKQTEQPEVTTTNKDDKSKETELEAKADEELPSVDATLTVSTNDYGNAAVWQDDKEIKLLGSKDEATIKTATGSEYLIRAYGDNPTLTLEGAKEVNKEVIENDDSITLYTIKVTDKDAKATLNFEGVTPLFTGFRALFAAPASGGTFRALFAAPASGGTLTGSAALNGTGTGKFWVSASDGKSSLYGVCCQRQNHSVAAKGAGVSLSKVSNTSAEGRIAYYGYTHSSEADQYAVSAASSKVRTGGTYDGDLYVSLANQANAGTLAAGPAGFEAYIGTNGSNQQMLLWRVVPVEGYLTMTKQVANNNAIVGECPNMYSMAGAEYTVYSNAGLTSIVGKLTIKADGSSNTLTLTEGTYYIKETKAPEGYKKDPTTHTVTITPDRTTSFTSKETPLFDPISIFLEKVPLDGEESFVNTNANMAGAEFTVKYYDSLDADVSSLTAKRTWNVVTKKFHDGRFIAQFSDEYLLEGSDEFFKNENGSVIIPRGTITIQETKSPIGYVVDNKVYTYRVEKNGETSMQFNFGNTPTESNRPLEPSIKTTAMDVATSDNVGSYGSDIKITDTINFEELYTAAEGVGWISYTVEGKLMDTETGEALLVDGKEVTAEKKFTLVREDYDGPTPSGQIVTAEVTGRGAKGSVQLNYNLGEDDLAGKSVTCFATLKLNDTGETLATHNDLADENQTVHFPEIGTKALDNNTGIQVSNADEEVSITDTVSYKNLIVGKEYTLNAKLMDKTTGNVLKDENDKDITATKTFTPANVTGSEEVTFTFKGTNLAGKTTVVFEQLVHNNALVAAHEDLEDVGQSIYFPEIGTQAMDSDSKDRVSNADDSVTIIDKVAYKSLQPGLEYTVKGIVMDKETGKALVLKTNDEENEDNTITAETTFTPETSDGVVEVKFTFDGSTLKNKDIVFFEKMYYGENFIVAEHTDIDDLDQTVVFPEIKTLASVLGTSDKVVKTDNATVVDEVSYKNLIPGKKYELNAKLMTQDGKTVVGTGTASFVPVTPNGTAKVNIEVTKASQYNGKSLVVFEEVTLNDGVVGEHKDLTDNDQTVTVNVPKAPSTGDTNNFTLYFLALLAGIGGIVATFAKKKQNK